MALAAIQLEGVRQGTAIIPFPLLPNAPEQPRCLWCRHEFTPVKSNQLFCKRKHSQYACERRKAGLVTAVATLLERHGMAQKRAQDTAAMVVEAFYATGRIQKAVKAMGWTYDEFAKEWKTA